MGEKNGEWVREERVGNCRTRVRVLEFFNETRVARRAEDLATGGGDDGGGTFALMAEVHLRTAVRHRDTARGHFGNNNTTSFPNGK